MHFSHLKYLIPFFLPLILAYQYVFYKNRQFPADTESRQISFVDSSKSNTSHSEENTTTACSTSQIGDMLCDSINNNEDCLFDGGDCCRGTCLAKCEAQSLSGSSCRCGENMYNCLSTSTSCYKCVHGTCASNMNECYSSDEYVKLAVKACSGDTFSHGNENTTDVYCGKDPDKSIVHFSSNPSYHYPGCGLEEIQCTENPCCSVVILNGDTYESCSSLQTSRYVWDSSTNSFSVKYTSCLEYFRQCFRENSQKGRGQCCQCEEGYGGIYCDTPICSKCVHGKCTNKDTCECDTNYKGEGCNIPICSNCVYGVCVEPEICECFYGYKGDSCEEIISHPLCVHGIESKGDKCICDSGFIGRLCEIKECDSNCDYCDDDGHCFENLYKNCKGIHQKCNECNYNLRICTNCDDGYVVQNGNCIKISEFIDNCFKGSINGCEECLYPYMMKNGICVFGGMVEIGQKNYDVVDNGNLIYFNISFYRFYGSDGECSVNYEIYPLNFFYEKFDRLVNNLGYDSFKNGIIIFDDGVDEVVVQVVIGNLNLQFYDNSNKKHREFQIQIFNPKGGCIIGEISYSVLTVYDSE